MKPSKLPNVADLLFPRTVDELFNQFWGDAKKSSCWVPSVDVRETDESFVITAELPGIEVSDVELTVTSEGLTLKGEKKKNTESEADTRRGHITERVYGEFSRSFSFPIPVTPDDVVAQARHGILTITVKKAEVEKTRRIEIKSE